MLDDDGVTSLSVTAIPSVANKMDGRWVVREVSNRVEFVLDGRPLSMLAMDTEIGSLEDQVTPFEFPGIGADAVLRGTALFEDWLPDPSRVPILLCPCGDLCCGALTVKLTGDDSAVEWSDWAWENYYEPALSLPLPVCRFDAITYEAALSQAGRVASANGELVTRVRVRRPGPWWRNIVGVPEERTDPKTMLGWLHAEAVKPSLTEADDGYADFLIELNSAQALLAGAASSKAELRGAARDEAIEALGEVLRSHHVISLPPPTVDAVRWHLDQLQR